LGFPLGAILATGVTPYLAETTGGWQGAFTVWGLMTLLFSAVWWFAVREPRLKKDSAMGSFMPSRAVLLNFPLWIAAASFFASSSIFSIEVAWFPALLAERGASGEQAGLMVSTLLLGNMLGVVAVPILSDRLGLRRPFLWGFFGGSVVAVFLFLNSSPITAWAILPVLGFASAGPFAMGFRLPAELVDYSHLGSASGIVLSVGWLGIGFGSWLAGFLRDLSGTFYTSLIALSISAFFGIALAFLLPETGRRGRLTRS
jgi:CP family cyanate transporter-like MFS transporter